MSSLTVSGAVSGLDTASIINQLVSVQGNQQTLLKTRQTREQTAADTLGKLSTALGSVGTLSAALARTSAWAGSSATSSSTSVAATATGTTTGAVTFDVAQLAAAHTLVSSADVASTSAVVASGGSVTLTRADGTTSTVAAGSGTLAEVVGAINGAGAGLTAAAVQTSPGQYRLQVTATSSGAGSSFTLGGLDGVTMDVLTEGSDAKITIGGSSAAAYDVTSSSNTFADVVPGLSFTVGKVETGVTVRSSLDGTAVAGQVSKLVDAVNGVLGQITTATAYDAAKKTGGPLLGDSTARSLQQRLLEAVGGAGAPGVRVTRDGTLSFDQDAFVTAFKADPDKVKTAFGASATFAAASGVSGRVAYSSSTSATRAGTYAVQVSRQATNDTWTLPAGSFAAGSVVQLARGTATIAYTVQSGDGAAQVAAGVTRAAAAAGFGVNAAADGTGALVLTAASAGSASSFTADVDARGVGGHTVAGVDVAGTIDGRAATGTGDILTLRAGTGVTGGAVGLGLDTTQLSAGDVAANGGAVGSVSVRPGLAARLANLADDFTATSGTLTSAQKGRQSSVASLQQQIDAWDRRLTSYRALLSAQFTAMETAIANLKSQTSSIASLVSSSGSGSSGSN